MQLWPGRPEENPYRHGQTYLIIYLAPQACAARSVMLLTVGEPFDTEAKH